MLYDPKSELNLVGRTIYEAANYMDEHGQCKGILWTNDGRVCLLGAVAKVCDNYELKEQCWAALHKHSGESVGQLAKWNNAPERTKDEVVSRLKDIASKCKVFA
jgi:hypothetical protein